MRPPATSQLWIRGVIALGAMAILASGLVFAASVALLLAPALVFVAVLAAGIFPGEAVLARARERRQRRVSRRPVRIGYPVLADFVRPVGVSLAYALAVRPPPAR